MEWFKFYGDFAHDPRVQMLDEAAQRRLVMLLCLQGSGLLANLPGAQRDAAIAHTLRIKADDWQQTQAQLRSLGLLDGEGSPSLWSSRVQAARAPATSTERVRRHRAARAARSHSPTTPAAAGTETDETRGERGVTRLEEREQKEKRETPQTEQGAAQASVAPALPPASRPQRGWPERGPRRLPDSTPAPYPSYPLNAQHPAGSERVRFADWVSAVHAQGYLPIAADDEVFAQAKALGVPEAFLPLAWAEFDARYRHADLAYADWRAVFRKAVRENWLRLWVHEADGRCSLSAAGAHARHTTPTTPSASSTQRSAA